MKLYVPTISFLSTFLWFVFYLLLIPFHFIFGAIKGFSLWKLWEDPLHFTVFTHFALPSENGKSVFFMKYQCDITQNKSRKNKPLPEKIGIIWRIYTPVHIIALYSVFSYHFNKRDWGLEMNDMYICIALLITYILWKTKFPSIVVYL